MNGQLSDNDFEQLINDGDLNLDAVVEPVVEPAAALPAPRQELSFFG